MKKLLMILIVFTLLFNPLAYAASKTFEDNEFGVIKINIEKEGSFGFFGSIINNFFSIVITPSTPKPREDINIQLSPTLECTARGIGNAEVIIKRGGTQLRSYDITNILNDEIPFGCQSVVIDISAIAPTTTGNYEVLFFAFERNTAIELGSELKSFTVEEEFIECPSSFETGWLDLGRTNDGNGNNEKNDVSTFSNPPNCDETITTKLRTICDSSHKIIGTQSDTVAPRLTSCEPIETLPRICNPFEQLSEESTCLAGDILRGVTCNSDGTNKITQEINCVSINLVCDSGSCVQEIIDDDINGGGGRKRRSNSNWN